MFAITTKFGTDHKLTNETSLKELSQYAPEILELLTTGMPLVDKEKRHQAHDHLQKGYKFSKEQAFALIPLQRVGRCKSQASVSKGPGLEAEEMNICQVSDKITDQKHPSNIAQSMSDQIIRCTEKIARISGLDEQNSKVYKDLDECVDRETVVDLIHEIVSTLINEKGKSSSDSSEKSDSIEIVKKRKAVPYKQQRRARLRK
ncbi:10927_t:CDS:2, partial [Ambispora leptoticha]